jgi:hypothetical protein
MWLRFWRQILWAQEDSRLLCHCLTQKSTSAMLEMKQLARGRADGGEQLPTQTAENGTERNFSQSRF